MKMNECVNCHEFACEDVKIDRYHIPGVELDPEKVSIVLISEAAAENPAENYD